MINKIYLCRGKWIDGEEIGDYMEYKDLKSGQKEAQEFWGGACKYIKVEKRKDGNGYKVFGVWKKIGVGVNI